MGRKSVLIDHWFYFTPDIDRNSEGRIILIEKRSFGPLEAYDWGIDKDNKPFEQYNWCENDLFEDSNYFRHITKKELTEQIEGLIRLFMHNELPEWVITYQKIMDWLNSDLLHQA